jgi:pyridoxal phosphate enzyme (YggS family)
MFITDNLSRLQGRIERARDRGGHGQPVTLVAVTKGRTSAEIREALAAGVTHVGENRVQEARGKWSELGWLEGTSGDRQPTRHLVGHLQRNKVAPALDLFDVVQSVDSLPLAHKISDLSRRRGRRAKVFVQVNAGEEESKHGFAPPVLEDVLPELVSLDGLEVNGVMAMAPFDVPAARLHAIFADVHERFQRLRAAATGGGLQHLSMGMSGDFEIAVEEGSTMVRI